VRLASIVSAFIVVVAVSACDKSSTPSTPTAPTVATTLTKPALDSPSDGAQLDNLRPTLTVVNGTSNQSGTKTYEFQVSDSSSFSAGANFSGSYATTVSGTGVAEDPSGKTKFTPTQDLQPTTKYYWRARMVQGTINSDWSDVRTFKTKLVGYNRPGELYDPLMFGETLGTIVGSTTWVAGTGITFNDVYSYLRYQLPQVVSSGEFSMEVTGLHPDGPGGKPKIFQLLDFTGQPSASSYMINAQYRGSPGNPDNCVAFKAVLGNLTSAVVEPDLVKRGNSVIVMNPSHWYLWQGLWTPTSFRLVIKDGGVNGTVIYDYQMDAPSGNFSPAQLYAYVGTNYETYSAGTGTFPGMTVRNVWLGNKPRPTSLGSALDFNR
jgi:hypothetical protein